MAEKSKAVTPEESKRKKLFAVMPKALQKTATGMAKRQRQIAEGTLVQAWRNGADVLQVCTDEAVYGSSAVEKLAEWFNVSPATLYNLRNFASDYSEDEVKALAARTMSNGHHIELKHCQLALRVAAKPGAKRDEVFERIFTECVSANQFADELATELDKKSKRTGRKPDKPVSVSGGMRSTDRVLTTLMNRSDIMEADVYGKITEMEPDRVNDGLLDSLDAQIELIESSVETLSSMQAQAKKARKRVKNVLERRAVAEKKKAAQPAVKPAVKPASEKGAKKSGQKPADNKVGLKYGKKLVKKAPAKKAPAKKYPAKEAPVPAKKAPAKKAPAKKAPAKKAGKKKPKKIG